MGYYYNEEGDVIENEDVDEEDIEDEDETEWK